MAAQVAPADDRYVQVVHAMPGRTRLRLSWLHGAPGEAASIAERLRAHEGVVDVQVRAWTGSLLCVHDHVRLPTAALVAAVASITGVDRVVQPGEAPPPPPPLPPPHKTVVAHELSAMFGDLDERVRRATEGRVDLGTLTTLTLLGLGAGEVASRGELPLPPWFNLAWWSFRTFVTFERAGGNGVRPPPDLDASD